MHLSKPFHRQIPSATIFQKIQKVFSLMGMEEEALSLLVFFSKKNTDLLCEAGRAILTPCFIFRKNPKVNIIYFTKDGILGIFICSPLPTLKIFFGFIYKKTSRIYTLHFWHFYLYSVFNNNEFLSMRCFFLKFAGEFVIYSLYKL